MIKSGYKEILERGLSFHYRNVSIEIYITNYSHHSIDVIFQIDLGLSVSTPFSSRNISTRKAFLSYDDDSVKIIDFQGGVDGETKSVGIGRQAINSVFAMLKAAFTSDTKVYGELSNVGGKPFDHARRVAFWRSCGFAVQDPDDYYSPIHTTVSELIVKDHFRGNMTNPFGVPYEIPFESFVPMDMEPNRKKDMEELATLPSGKIHKEIESIPTISDVEAENTKQYKKVIMIRDCLTVSCSILAGGFAYVTNNKEHTISFIIAGAIAGFFMSYRYISLPVKNITAELRNKGRDRIRVLLSNWSSSNPTGLAFLSKLSKSHGLDATEIPVSLDCSCLSIEEMEKIANNHRVIFNL